MYMTLEQVIELKNRINPDAWLKEVTLVYESKRFFRRARDLIRKDRFGEVIFAVERPNGTFVAITSAEYPEGVYRIPTGGISYGEDIVGALHREVKEELGLDVVMEKFVGVLSITLTHGGESVPFYSFLFHMKEIGGRILEDATEDEVSAYLEADAKLLYELTDRLLTIRPSWRDWGLFRHTTTSAVATYAASLNTSCQ